jgi:16S rRNA (cytidine1402-2'-O)-methyltransferase
LLPLFYTEVFAVAVDADQHIAGGVLYIVATPIGNLADITERARTILGQADCVLAEDTRHTLSLCRHYGLQPQLLSLHEHNEEQRVSVVLQRLGDGQSLALVSDAGTPLINDPGYRIVAACHEAGYQVSPVPGPSALLAALSVCGLPTDRFTYHGFLPAKAAARRQCLLDLQQVPATQVFFESCHRIVECLQDIVDVLGAERQICLAREITKRYESISRGSAGDLLCFTRDDANQQKGEFVVLVQGAPPQDASFGVEHQQLLLELARELPPRKATAIVAKHAGLERKLLYDWLLANKEG